MEYITPDKKIIVGCINKGRVVAIPTDTVYGLVGLANKEVVSNIFRIKQRPKDKGLPVFVSSIEMAKSIGEINKKVQKFLKFVWPGKVTVIVKNKKVLNGFASSTIALRMPGDKLILSILKQVAKPLTGTSANISGHASCVKGYEVYEQFKSKEYVPDLIVIKRGRPVKNTETSTIIDLTKNHLKIIRIGAVNEKVIESLWDKLG